MRQKDVRKSLEIARTPLEMLERPRKYLINPYNMLEISKKYLIC